MHDLLHAALQQLEYKDRLTGSFAISIMPDEGLVTPSGTTLYTKSGCTISFHCPGVTSQCEQKRQPVSLAPLWLTNSYMEVANDCLTLLTDEKYELTRWLTQLLVLCRHDPAATLDIGCATSVRFTTCLGLAAGIMPMMSFSVGLIDSCCVTCMREVWFQLSGQHF